MRADFYYESEIEGPSYEVVHWGVEQSVSPEVFYYGAGKVGRSSPAFPETIILTLSIIQNPEHIFPTMGHFFESIVITEGKRQLLFEDCYIQRCQMYHLFERDRVDIDVTIMARHFQND